MAVAIPRMPSSLNSTKWPPFLSDLTFRIVVVVVVVTCSGSQGLAGIVRADICVNCVVMTDFWLQQFDLPDNLWVS